MESFSLVFNERPKAKARPRATKTGHVYTPKTTAEAEKRIAAAWEEADGPMFDGAVVTVYQSPHSAKTLTGDIDNYVKLTCDALNGVAWEDDKQIVRLMAVKVDRFDNSKP